MLNRLFRDIREVVQISMIVIHVSDSREVQTRQFILNDGKVSKIRHKVVYHSRKRICIRILCGIGIKFQYLRIARTSLEHKSRAIWSACLYIYHESYIIKHIPITLPHRTHSHHSDLLSISEEHLYALFPCRTLLKSMSQGLQNDSDTIAIISSSIRPNGILRHRLRIA